MGRGTDLCSIIRVMELLWEMLSGLELDGLLPGVMERHLSV